MNKRKKISRSRDRAALMAGLQGVGVLRSMALARAMEEIDRADFVPEALIGRAYEDAALPIGVGQTISQPYTVIFMLELLSVRPGHSVLEAGSGWQTALLAHVVGPMGKVYVFEVLPQMCEMGKRNIEKYLDLAKRVEFFCQNAQNGYAPGAPYDAIIAAAEVRDVPKAWREQLRVGGRMVYPQAGALVLEIRREDGTCVAEKFPGFVFVPFKKE